VRAEGLSLELSATSRDASLRPFEAAWPQQLARFLRRWADAPEMIPAVHVAEENAAGPVAGRIEPQTGEPDAHERPLRDAA
jgi:hypothetical protein